MWEFLSRKKEVPAPAPETPLVSGAVKAEDAPKVETAAEQAAEQVGEKFSAILTQSGAAASAVPQEIHTDAEQVGQSTDAASRVNQLVELAQVKGVAHAVAVARKLNDLYVLDTMHDELADKLYDAFKAKGLIRGE